MVSLLLDTQILVWLQTGDRRLSTTVRAAIFDGENRLLVSAAVAWEYSDLMRRRRLPVRDELDLLVEELGLIMLDLPGDMWRQVRSLPDIHRDPVDRMLVAHAIVQGMTLVTADETVRRYPVDTLW